MIVQISFQGFKDYFLAKGRGSHFSHDGLEALFNLLEERYDGAYELDVVELCSAYSEYTLEAAKEQFEMTEEEMDYHSNFTKIPEGYIVQNY